MDEVISRLREARAQLGSVWARLYAGRPSTPETVETLGLIGLEIEKALALLESQKEGAS